MSFLFTKPQRNCNNNNNNNSKSSKNSLQQSITAISVRNRMQQSHGSLAIKESSASVGSGGGGGGGGPALLHVVGPMREPLQRKFSISACRRQSTIELPDNQFILTMIISNAETNEQIWYKQDGSRFGGSQLTLKFATNSMYKIYVKTKPAQNFTTLNIANNELKLIPIQGGAGEYAAAWNTADKLPTKKGTRQDVDFVLSGMDKLLNKKLQVKFYAHNDSHAGWGQKLDQITWQCAFNELGNVTIIEEQTL